MESDLPEMRIATIPQWKFMASWYWKLLALGLPLEPNLIQFGGFNSMGGPQIIVIIRVTDDHFSTEAHGDDDPAEFPTLRNTGSDPGGRCTPPRLGGEVAGSGEVDIYGSLVNPMGLWTNCRRKS